jgi:hypothetical protein
MIYEKSKKNNAKFMRSFLLTFDAPEDGRLGLKHVRIHKYLLRTAYI